MNRIRLKTNKNHPAIQAYSRAVERGMKSQHVVPRNDGWAVKRGGTDRVSRVFDTQENAKEYAIKIAKNAGVSLFVHGRDGKIKDRRDY